MSKKRHISFWLTEEDMNGYQCQILMPVIFCKDCKYWKEDVPHNAYCEFMKLHGFEPDDFCSRGVKR